jgi:uncharacterized protein
MNNLGIILFFINQSHYGFNQENKMTKYHVTYDKIHSLIADKSNLMKEFNPDFIIGIAGGGMIPSRIVRSFVSAPLLAIGISLYDEKNHLKSTPEKLQWLDEKNLKKIKGKKILLVDEIDDTRTTLSYCVDQLWECGVEDILVFVIENKKKPKKSLNLKDNRYISGEEIEDVWVVYPWDSLDINEHNKNAIKP